MTASVPRPTPEVEDAFRAEVRAWLAARTPFAPLAIDDDERVAQLAAWQRDLFDAGYCGVSFPVEYGGRGLNPVFEAILMEEMGAAGAPSAFHYGYVARVIYENGTPEQREREVRRALRGDDRWSQGFSEPDAGSDLAAVRTRAVLDGDHFVITGQKVWTSRAHWADFTFMLVRTGESDSRHRGLSTIIVPTRSSGLTIRPFRQMTGGLEFAELFLDEVRVPAENLVGPLHGGWAVAMSTVAYERGPSDVGRIADLRSRLGHLAADARDRHLPPSDPRAERLAAVHVDLEVLGHHVLRSLRDREGGHGDLSGTSVDKLLATRTEQALAHLELDLLGADALLGRRPGAAFEYLESRAASVYGGSTQIQLGIVATRVLGLPRE